MINPPNPHEPDWRPFTGRPARPLSPHAVRTSILGKCVLITGAGGYIGAALATAIAQLKPASLLLLDQGELGLHELQEELSSQHALQCPTECIVGSVLDSILLRDLFSRHRPEIVFHAAACKHVPLMETNPFVAVATNVLGTEALIQIASDHGAAQFVLLSTDKAVEPVSIMGATKHIAEQIVRTHTSSLRAKALRLGNVLGSSGSVVPLFLRQIARGGPLTVTHPDAMRFFLPINDAVSALLTTLTVDAPSSILTPDMGQPHRIHDLAQFLIARHAPPSSQIAIEFIGLRPGDKLEERMTSHTETVQPLPETGLNLVDTASISPHELNTALQDLHHAVHARDLPLLLNTVATIVPGYAPGDLLRRELKPTAQQVRA